MSAPRIRSALHQGVACLRLTGELRHPLAEAIEDFSDEVFGTGSDEVRQLVLDLGEASFMDSTVIGLLVALAREARAHGLSRPTVICSHPDLLDMFRAMRLEPVFQLTSMGAASPTDVGNEPPAPTGSDDTLRQARLVLKAHEALIAADDANRVAFGAVVDLLREEVARLEREAAAS